MQFLQKEKPIYRNNCIKGGGDWTVCRLKGAGLGKKEEVGVFVGVGVGGGGDNPMHTRKSPQTTMYLKADSRLG